MTDLLNNPIAAGVALVLSGLLPVAAACWVIGGLS